jgi:phosphotransferase system enzyme I (PtsI)
MAGQPRAFVLLLGMGLRQFSMSPAFVPTTKQLAAKITSTAAEKIFQQSLRLKTTANVKRYMAECMREIAPDLSILDSN